MAMDYFQLAERRRQIAECFGSAHTVREYGPFSEEAMSNMCDMSAPDTHPEAGVDVEEVADPASLAPFEAIRFDGEMNG